MCQMIEELFMAFLMSIAFSLPVYYLCKLQGSFFIVWLVWLVSLADGIGDRQPSFFVVEHMHTQCYLETAEGAKLDVCNT